MLIASTKRSLPSRAALTLIEVLTLLVVLVLLAALFMPSVRTAREAARRMQCSNNLKQLSLAALNYESAYKIFPSAMAGTGNDNGPRAGNVNRLSGMVAMLPFLESNGFWSEISEPSVINGQDYPAMGPAPWIREYTPWQADSSFLKCSSDANGNERTGTKNYGFVIGDQARQIHQPEALRGAFACRLYARLDDVEDGASNTLGISEFASPNQRSVIGNVAIGQPSTILDQPAKCLDLIERRAKKYSKNVLLAEFGRGEFWADGSALNGLVNTILPPNAPSCAIGDANATDGYYTAGSMHASGANAAMVDGSVHFFSENIDAGMLSSPTLSVSQLSDPRGIASPYGVWGALGTINGQEKSDEL